VNSLSAPSSRSIPADTGGEFVGDADPTAFDFSTQEVRGSWTSLVCLHMTHALKSAWLLGATSDSALAFLVSVGSLLPGKRIPRCGSLFVVPRPYDRRAGRQTRAGG
jgi:hypothetical protein